MFLPRPQGGCPGVGVGLLDQNREGFVMVARVVSSSDDVIDVRDVIARVEELRGEAETAYEERNPGAEGLPEGFDWSAYLGEGDRDECGSLMGLLDDLRGDGGDEQWEGDWFPVTLVRFDYFEDYARELAEDIGAIPNDYSWPTSHIDWAAAADALLMDYTSVEFEGVTFYTR